MEISFQTKELRDIFEKTSRAKRLLGDDSIEVFHVMIADLSAAPTLGSFPHQYFLEVGSDVYKYKLYVSPSIVICFETTGLAFDDPSKAVRIKITEIQRL